MAPPELFNDRKKGPSALEATSSNGTMHAEELNCFNKALPLGGLPYNSRGISGRVGGDRWEVSKIIGSFLNVV